MPMKEIARELQGKAANLALRMPISWVNILAGPPVDGRRPHARRPHPVVPAVAGTQRPAADAQDERGRRPRRHRRLPAAAERTPRTGRRDRRSHHRRARPAGCASASTGPAGAVARLLPTILYFHGGGWVIGSLEGYDLRLPLSLRAHRLRRGRRRLPAGAGAQVPGRHRRRRRRLSLAVGGGRRASASTRRASSWRAIRRAARSPPCWPGWSATTAGRPACNG